MTLSFADARHHYLPLDKLTKLAKTNHIPIETPCAVISLLPVPIFDNIQLSGQQFVGCTKS